MGSLTGLAYNYSLPCIVYMMIQRQRGKLSLPSAVFHSFIVLIGVLNFMSQFFIWASQTHLLFIKRKQRKSLPWRWFGYRVLISIKFSELLLWISPRFMDGLRGHIKNSKECFIRYPNTSKSVKKLGCASFFQPTSRGWISWWNTFSRVWYIT